MRKIIFLILITSVLIAQEKRPLTFQDVMQFNEIISPILSEDGKWIAYNLQPDRGDGAGIVKHSEDSTTYRIERGTKPYISKNSRWAVFTVVPPMLETVNVKKDKRPKDCITIIDLKTGKLFNYKKVRNYSLSESGDWLAVHFADTSKGEKSKSPLSFGSELLLNYLPDSSTVKLQFVTEFVFDSLSRHLGVAIRDTASHNDKLIRVDLLTGNNTHIEIITSPYSYFSNLTWNKQGSQLAFVNSIYDTSNYPQPGTLEVWSTSNDYKTLLSSKEVGEGWVIPFNNKIKFSRDGERLFFGRLPADRFQALYTKKEEVKFENEKDEATLLEKAEVDVWHGNDGRINSNQKKEWEKNAKRTYTAVYHLDQKKYLPLTDEEMPFIDWNESEDYAIGRSNVPYLKSITWEGNFFDYYRVDLNTADRQQIATRIEDNAIFSPNGKFIVYYFDKNWQLVNLANMSMITLTSDVDAPFENEDHDYPSPPPGYGIAGWTANDESVLIYDKYDIWQFPTNGKEPLRLTEGREDDITFRVRKLDREKKFFDSYEKLFLEGYHQEEKYSALFSCRIGVEGVKELLKAEKKINIVAKSKQSDRFIYTEQTYQQFPDLIMTDTAFTFSKKITDANPQMKNFLWGEAELVEWETEDDIPLQGVLIKPANYEEGKQYPVLVYFYRFFSQRLYQFNQPKINHRPCFPLYTSNDYVIFLPDIKFEIGAPGPSATKCLVSGVNHLIELGIAKPDAVGLHGHSWSGYQTAFVITETDLFKCAIAGAPVSNMTSAYSGIRWGTGLARQFQYEQTQSRIGGTLVEMPEKYIKNSPVFFANKVNTPLLLMFGDIDEAVRSYQGIELYLALRRFNKDVIFLQYRDEPHHLKKYPNKLDYAKRMKEYFDYHLMGTKPAAWISDGVPYSGK